MIAHSVNRQFCAVVAAGTLVSSLFALPSADVQPALVDNVVSHSAPAGNAISTPTGNAISTPTGNAISTPAYTSQSTERAVAVQSQPTLISNAVTHNSATLTLVGHTGGWWVKRTAPTTGICTPETATNTHGLTTLTPGTIYTYTAYDDSNCRSQDELASVSFTTPGVALSTTRLIVPEAGTAAYTAALTIAPTATVTVTLTSTGDTDITLDTDTKHHRRPEHPHLHHH